MKEYHYQKEFFKTSVSVAIEKIETTLLPFFKLEKEEMQNEKEMTKAIKGLKVLLGCWLNENYDIKETEELKTVIEKLELDLIRIRFINQKYV